MGAAKLRRARKAIGAGAFLVATVATLWAGGPDWVVTVGAGAAWLATWGLANDLTQRQRDQLREQAEAGRLSL